MCSCRNELLLCQHGASSINKLPVKKNGDQAIYFPPPTSVAPHPFVSRPYDPISFNPSSTVRRRTQRPSTLEPRKLGNTNRPSSAAPHRRLGGADSSGSGVGYRRKEGNAVGSGFRPRSGGARTRTTRGVGARANALTGNLLPPGEAGPGGQLSARQSQLFAPAALSAAYGSLSDGARKVEFLILRCNLPCK